MCFGQRRRAEARALMADDARLHHHAPGVRAQPDRDRRAPAAAEPRAAAALARAEAVADMPGLLRGPHHLADEGLRALAAAVAVLDAPGPDAQVVVARRHEPEPRRESRATALGALKSLQLFAESASSGCWWRWRIPQSSQPHAPRRGPAFSLAVRGLGSCAAPPPHANLRHSPPEHDRSPSGLIAAAPWTTRRRTAHRTAARAPVQSCAERSIEGRDDCGVGAEGRVARRTRSGATETTTPRSRTSPRRRE